MTDSLEATTASAHYTYDLDGNVHTEDVCLPNNPQAGYNIYGYDDAGRLITWSFSNTTVEYGWDGAGNRTSAGSDTYSYDAGNRPTSGPDGVYTYTPRGDLATITSGATETTYSFDALGRLVDYNGEATFSYDGLDRVADRNAVGFTYIGTMLDPASDGSFTYGRSPAGRLVSQTDGQTTQLVGLDRHGDLTWLANPTSGAITDTVMYDPYGDPTGTSGGTNPTVGFQGDYTDPTSGEVWMGARWYNGADAVFRSRDTVFGELHTPISLNRYTYAWANPNSYWDPDGRTPGYTEGLDGPALKGSMKASAPSNNVAYATPGSDMYNEFIKSFSDEVLAAIVEQGRINELISLVRSYGEAAATPMTASDMASQLVLAINLAHLDDNGLTTAEIKARVTRLSSKFSELILRHRDLALPRGDLRIGDAMKGLVNGGIISVNWLEGLIADHSDEVLCPLLGIPGNVAGTSGCGTGDLINAIPDIPKLACDDQFSCETGEGAFILGMFMWSIWTAPTALEQLATLARGLGQPGISEGIAADRVASTATNTADELLPGLPSSAPNPAGLGSTGRTVPNNLTEQLAMTEVRSAPAGQQLTRVTMTDPRWPAGDGWVKMAQNVNGVEIHYVRNTITGAVDDFKFIGGAG